MMATPQSEHEWLHKLIGEWTYEAECVMGPGEPAAKTSGSETVRSIGGLWIVAEGSGEMPDGGAATTMMTLGYDPQQQRYLGTFVASMMTHLWVYDGEMNAAGNELTLKAEGPSMAGDGSMAQYKDVIEIKADDRRVMRSYVLNEDGTWAQIMSADYRRKG